MSYGTIQFGIGQAAVKIQVVEYGTVESQSEGDLRLAVVAHADEFLGENNANPLPLIFSDSDSGYSFAMRSVSSSS